MEGNSSPKRPRFHCENVNQLVRIKNQQEMMNRQVMLKTVRVVNIPNPSKQSIGELVEKFLETVVKYGVVKDLNPLSWAKPAGSNKYGVAFKGRNNLIAYNKLHETKIHVIRCQTIQVGDLESLSLFLRRKIKDKYEKFPFNPEINVKNAFLTIKNIQGDVKIPTRSSTRQDIMDYLASNGVQVALDSTSSLQEEGIQVMSKKDEKKQEKKIKSYTTSK